MLCDNETCRNRGINCFNSSGTEIVPNNDFCRQLRHIKCKVARLARTQIQKNPAVPNYRTHQQINAPNPSLRAPAISSSEENVDAQPTSDKGKAKNAKHVGDTRYNADKNSDDYRDPNLIVHELREAVVIPRPPTSVLGYANVVPGAKVFSYWIKCISKYFTKQLKVLLVAIIIGILMWMALVYGAILGTSLCSNGQFPILQFGSSRTRVSVF